MKDVVSATYHYMESRIWEATVLTVLCLGIMAMGEAFN